MPYENLVRDLRHDGGLIAKLGSPVFTVKQGVDMLAAADAIEKLQYIHLLDQSEIVRLRRQIDFLMEDANG